MAALPALPHFDCANLAALVKKASQRDSLARAARMFCAVQCHQSLLFLEIA
ncbi:MAG: hypothetical protein O9296_07970 [Novosphingobium sp.]|nr:hypothetical protein [Novosphingobium sp.]